MTDIEIVEGDLLDQDVDAIVNAWNRNIIPWWLLIPQGVSRAIKRRAGYQPFRELARGGPIPLGRAVATGTGGKREELVLGWMQSELEGLDTDVAVKIVRCRR